MAEQLYRKRISPAAASNVDDLVSKNVLAQLRRDPPPRPAALTHPPEHGQGAVKPSTGGAGGGHGPASAAGTKPTGAAGGGVDASDLISSMAKRLGALEREMKERQSLLQQVQADNAMLKSKLKVAEEEIAKRAIAAIEPRDDSAAVMHLRSENARLRAQLKYAWKQVAEMKAFLNDYGMVWMGEPEAEAELAAQGYGSLAAPPSARSLSPEASDLVAPRRTSHSGAAPGPSSAAAAATAAATAAGSVAAARPRAGADVQGQDAGRKLAGGLSPAAAAALDRAGGKVGDGASGGSGSGLAGATTAAAAAQSAGGPEAATAPAAAPAAAAAAAPAAKRTASLTSPLVPLPSGSRPSSVASPRSAPSAPSAVSSSPNPHPRTSVAAGGLPFSMAELQAKVDELNDLAGDGCGQIVRDAAGQHVLAMRDPVSLVIYRDGLQIHTLPAKPFNDPASNAVLRDVLDGYFPYVLKRDFPDGVPLRVVDRTGESIASVTPGRRLGAAGGAGGGMGGGGGGGGNIRTFGDIDAQGPSLGAAEPMSRDKFLSRLPQAVIKNGKVIEIRSDISRIMGGGAGGAGGGAGDGAGKADVALVTTPVDALLSTLQRNHMGPSLPPPSREGQPPATEVTTLQVKSVDGKQSYILKLKYDDTIGGLRSCIDAHHAKGGQAGVKYEIRSAFPARAYTEDGETLRHAGLIPNATLFLRAV